MRRFLLWTAVLLPSFGAFMYFVALAGSSYANEMYGLVKITMLLVVLTGWRLSKNSIHQYFRWTMDDAKIGLLWGIILACIITLAFFVLHQWLVPFSDLLETKATSFFPLAWFGVLAIAFSLIHSFFEEFYWRGYVHTQIEQTFHPITASFLSATAFTAHHVIILSQLFPGFLSVLLSVGVFAAGLLWATILRRTGSLISVWISHAMADGAILTAGYILMIS